MSAATTLLEEHFRTLVDDNVQWQTLIADEIVWELAFAPSLGHPARLTGREEVIRHATWFAGAVENFRFSDLKLYEMTDPDRAVAEIKGEESSRQRDARTAKSTSSSSRHTTAR